MRRSLPVLLALGLALGISWVLVKGGSGSPPVEGPPIEIMVPAGATFREVVDTLQARGLVGMPRLFRAYARLKGAEREIRSGAYAFTPGVPWSEILHDLTIGRVLTETLTIPEGFRLTQMAPRIGAITGLEPDSVLTRLTADSLDVKWGVPGPGLEGYLFPDSYRFAQGAPLSDVLQAMVDRYHEFWTPERVARREALGMTQDEVVTLASIVQAEARVPGELPVIASVYHNRLASGQLLQADPTVLFALGGYRARLLYAAMDSVADHPYNTYTHPGLPPGPIGAPGEEALEAALHPAETEFHYFVARPDGTHVFSRTLAEHNQAVARLRPEWERYRQEQGQGPGPKSP
jgi:UPF0755 protein